MARAVTPEQEEIIRHVLWYFNERGGWEPGGFTQLILRAYQKADPGNRARLRRGFPEYAEAMDLVLNSMGGIKQLAQQLEDGPAAP